MREFTFQFQVTCNRKWQNEPQHLLIFKLNAENGLIAEASLQAVLSNFLITQLELIINSAQCESKSLHFVVIFGTYMGYLLTLYWSLSTFLQTFF